MSNIIEKIAVEIAEQLLEKIKNGYIPELSKKYNIPEQDLIDILEGGEMIRSKQKSSSSSVAESTIKDHSINIEKINKALKKATDANKYLNISTMKAVADNKTNRSKLLFNETHKIVAKKDDEQLFNTCVASLGGGFNENSEDEQENEVEQDSIEVSEEKPKPNAKSKLKTKVITPESEDSEIESSDESSVIPEPTKTVEVPDIESSEDCESESLQPIKAKTKEKNKKETKNPKVKTPENSSSEESSITSSPKKDKQSKKIKTPENSEHSSSEDVKVQPLKPKFHKDLKKWWHPDTGFVVNKQGFNKYIVVGRIVDDKICNLTEKDIKKCEKRGWNYRSKKVNSSSESSSCCSSST
jgi:hypothetical protein